jgi:ankyrin repeat protein
MERTMKKTAAMVMLLLIGLSIEAVQVQASADMKHTARAIAIGDVNSLKSILKRSQTVVRTRDNDERTLLHYCADRSIIPDRFSISHKPERLGQDHEKWQIKSKEMAEILLSHGADVNAKDVFFQTPLHYAATTGNIEVARILVAHRGDVDAKNRFYSSRPLHLAALNGHISIAKLLIENGADVNAQDAFGAPVNMAAGRDMLMLLLHNKADAGTKDKDGFTPLHLVEDKEVAQLLISHGAKLDTRGYEGRTPLHQVAMRNENDMVEWFCSKGSPVNALDSKGQTPLMLSLSMQGYNIDAKTRTETVKILLHYGADLSRRDEKGWTLLHYAIRESNTDIVELFLRKGMDINAKDKYGYTPLHWAVTNNDKKMVEALVSRGADVNARNLQGNTPLYDTWGGSAVDIQISDILKSRGGTR